MQDQGAGQVEYCLATSQASGQLGHSAPGRLRQLDKILATARGPLAVWHTAQRKLHFPCVGNTRDAAL